MREFNDLCKEVENIDWDTRAKMIRAKSEELLPLLSSDNQDGMSGSEIFALFLLGAMSADNRLSEEEYKMLYPFLKDFLGDSINYNDVRKAVAGIKKGSKELKDTTEKMIKLIGKFSEDLRQEIVLVVMLICGADNKISLRERMWIRRLLF